MKKTTNKETQGQNQNKVSRDEVAQRAYQLWVAAGQPSGRDLEYLAAGRGGTPCGQAERSFAGSGRLAGEPEARNDPATRPFRTGT